MKEWSIAAFAVLIFLDLSGLAAQAASLTGPQIVVKCQAAYNGLTSYAGTVQSTSGSKSSAYATKSTVRITFQRPNLMDVEGSVQFPGGHSVPFGFLTDGKTNLVNIQGHWNRQQSADRALAILTGISGGAASAVPAMLMHTSWGAPSLLRWPAPAAISTETVNGRLAYRIPVAQGPTTDTYWVDSKTFLFVKIATTLTGFSSTKVFLTPVLNHPTALSLAAIRKKMPHIPFHE